MGIVGKNTDFCDGEAEFLLGGGEGGRERQLSMGGGKIGVKRKEAP